MLMLCVQVVAFPPMSLRPTKVCYAPSLTVASPLGTSFKKRAAYSWPGATSPFVL